MRSKAMFLTLFALSLVTAMKARAVDTPIKTPLLKPVSMLELFVEPDKRANIQFVCREGKPERKEIFQKKETYIIPDKSPDIIPYDIIDYNGDKVGDGSLLFNALKGNYTTSLKLKIGLYELLIPSTEQRFGVCAIPAFKGERDGFFGMETCVNRYPRQKIYQSLRLLKRSGIGSVREYDPWHHYEKVEGTLDMDKYPVYQALEREGLKAVYFFSLTPEWSGANNARRTPACQPYPVKILKLERSIMAMVAHRAAALNAVQIYNEPELLHTQPCEAVMPIVEACSWFFAKRGVKIPLAGPALAGGMSMYRALEPCFKSGLLDYIDIFAFHSYRKPEDMIPLIKTYRGLMEPNPKKAMPIWITECGKSWKRGIAPKQMYGGSLGKLRAPLDEDKTSALWITMKAIEAKAGGVVKYFPFILRFFPEQGNNFAMMDFYWTPMRSMAAYVYCVMELSRKNYIGDLKKLPNGVKSARVFANDKTKIATLYTQNIETVRVNLKDIPIINVTGMDGRPLTLNPDGSLDISGGLAYAHLKNDFAMSEINQKTEAKELFDLAKSYKPIPRKATPVIFQFCHWNVAGKTVEFYLGLPSKFEVNMINLSDKSVTIEPELTLPKGVKIINSTIKDGKLTLAPRTREAVVWNLNFDHCATPQFNIELRDKNGQAGSLYLPFFNKEKLAAKTFDFTNPKRWRANSNGDMTVSFDKAENALKVQTFFPNVPAGHDFWVYPEFVLNLPEESLDGAVGVSFDIKAKQDKGSTYFPHHGLHVVYENIKEKGKDERLKYPRPSAEWQNMFVVIDPEKAKDIKLLRIGMGSADKGLTYWVKNVKVHYAQ